MKTIGIGVDIINNKRIKNSIKNKNFLSRVFEFWTIHIKKLSDSYLCIDVLMQYNDLVRTVLQPGQILRLPYTRYQGGQADTAPPPPPSFRQHTLMSGETLTEVVEKFGISLDALVGANPDLSSLDLLPVGVELLIPPVGAEGLLVTIQPGETLIDILGQYRINPVALARINGITGPNDLQPGMMI